MDKSLLHKHEGLVLDPQDLCPSQTHVSRHQNGEVAEDRTSLLASQSCLKGKLQIQ